MYLKKQILMSLSTLSTFEKVEPNTLILFYYDSLLYIFFYYFGSTFEKVDKVDKVEVFE
jgi:hypothetical protein